MQILLWAGAALHLLLALTVSSRTNSPAAERFRPDPRLNPANATLVKFFRDQHYEPEAYTLYTYAAIQAWAQAAQKAGSVDGTKVEASLHANQFDSVLGKIGFDAKGAVTAPGYVLYVWKDGKYGYTQ